MQTIFNDLEQRFHEAFGSSATHRFTAPGRVNLIGEHTDYNGGFVLPCAIDRYTIAVVRARRDRKVRVLAVDYADQIDEFSLDEVITSHSDKNWVNYVRGVVQVLLRRGYAISGLDLAIAGNIPQGAGLSSSASLEVLVAHCFNTLCDLGISRTDLALIGQQAENEFVGMMCGVMDQLICAKGVDGHALLIDCRSLTTQAVRIPENLTVLIIDSKKTRGLVESEYNTRRQQCEAAARYFDVEALRDVTMEDWVAATDLDGVVARRARHIISENARTEAAAKALASGDVKALSGLMSASHDSMRDDFEITVPEIDWLVATANAVLGDEGGVRMTGGGFGGCVVAVLPENKVEQVQRRIDDAYTERFGLKAVYYRCQPSAGVTVVS